MPAKARQRWPPSMGEFRKMVALVAAEGSSVTVADVFHAVRRRCPEWAVTPYRVRKALAALLVANRRKLAAGASSSSAIDGNARAYPHDVVELRPSAGRSRHAQWQWVGQVLRVAGYDDGEATDDEDQELPAGHCSVFWLGHGLEQWPNALTKETSVRALDRPWVLGDRVAKADDPRSLGTVTSVACRLVLSSVPGPAIAGPDGQRRNLRMQLGQPEVPVQGVRAVGGFRAEDWVSHESTRWVGKVEEAVFRVEVELCGKSEQRPLRSKGRHRPPCCVFQVSSEGLQGLEPAGGEDVTPQELSPHFPGQRVKAPARLWRQAEWLRGSLGRRSPRRGTTICGIVSSVECCLLAIRWLAGVAKESQPPDEWVSPESVHVLTVPNSSEGWAIGDHVQGAPHWPCPSAVIVRSHTTVDVRWADGSVEVGAKSLSLCPRPHISAHDFLPGDFVARSSEGFGDEVAPPPAGGGVGGVGGGIIPGGHHSILLPVGHHSWSNEGASNENEHAYWYPMQGQENNPSGEILPTDSLGPPQAETPLGIVASVNLQTRTAVVQWANAINSDASLSDPEEVSVFELTDHPNVDVRLGDAVLVVDVSESYSVLRVHESQWAGRVCALRAGGTALIELVDGVSQWHDVRRLIVIDDGDGSETAEEDGLGSEVGSTHSDGGLSEISEGEHAALSGSSSSPSSESDSEVWAEAHEEQQVDASASLPSVREAAASPVLPAASSASSSDDADAAVDSGAGSGPAAACPASSSSSTAAAEKEPGSSASSSEPAVFDVCDEDVEPTDHFFVTTQSASSRQQMVAVRREMVVLRKGLIEESFAGTGEGDDRPHAPILVRTFSSRSDLFRAMVVGPPDTPYACVPFFFDFVLPDGYPREPPLAHFHAHHVGNERLNPNLYVDGKVCLSLLGTWSGPAWDPSRSTLLQVLVSLQGLVLVEEPYFNEPGHECDAGTEQGRQSSALYNEHARLLALRAALNTAQNPPRGFEEIVARYFERYGPRLVTQCEEDLEEPRSLQTSEGFRKVLAKNLLPRLRERWGLCSL